MKTMLDKLNRNRPLLYGNIVLLFFLLTGLAAKLDLRADFSPGRVNSLSESTERVFAKLDERLLVEAYITQDLPGQFVALVEPIRQQLREIERTGGRKVKLRVINPDTEEKRKQAESRGVRGVPIEEAKVAQTNVRLGFFGIYMQIGKESAVLSLLNQRRGSADPFLPDFEYQFLREVKKLARVKQGGGAGIGLAAADGLFRTARPRGRQDIRKDNLFIMRNSLEQETGRLTDVPLSKKVPENIRTLILAGKPRLRDKERYHLDQFLMRGGNIVAMFSGSDFNIPAPQPRGFPGMQRRQQYQALVNRKEVEGINTWLGGYGITVNPEILLEYEQAAEMYDLNYKFASGFNNPTWAVYTSQQGHITSEHPALEGRPALRDMLKDTRFLMLPWVSGLDLREAKQPGVKFMPFIRSTPGAVSKTSTSLEPQFLYKWNSAAEKKTGRNIPVAVLAQGKFKSTFTPETVPEGENKERFLAGQSGKTTGTLTVIGSSFMVSDIILRRNANARYYRLNLVFLTNLLETLGGDTDLQPARSRIRSIESIQRTGPTFESLFKWFHIFFIPIIIAILGTMRLMRRNRRLGLEEAKAEKVADDASDQDSDNAPADGTDAKQNDGEAK